MKKFEMPDFEIEKLLAMDVIATSDPFGDLEEGSGDNLGNKG